jgi:3-keto-5-aminohexanoate cleavage enzyme
VNRKKLVIIAAPTDGNAMDREGAHVPVTPEEIARLFPQAKWAVLATDRDQFPMNTLGVAMGCDIVRVGFEDNIYLPDGKPARRNHELVAAMARIARDFGRDVATTDEAREIFGLRR